MRPGNHAISLYIDLWKMILHEVQPSAISFFDGQYKVILHSQQVHICIVLYYIDILTAAQGIVVKAAVFKLSAVRIAVAGLARKVGLVTYTLT